MSNPFQHGTWKLNDGDVYCILRNQIRLIPVLIHIIMLFILFVVLADAKPITTLLSKVASLSLLDMFTWGLTIVLISKTYGNLETNCITPQSPQVIGNRQRGIVAKVG